MERNDHNQVTPPLAPTDDQSGEVSGSLDWSRPTLGRRSIARLVLLSVAYLGLLIAMHWIAYVIRFEFHPPTEQKAAFWRIQEWFLLTELFLLSLFGQFRSMLSYFSLPDAERILSACALTGIIAIIVWYVTQGQGSPPRSITILSVLLDTFALIVLRLFFRKLREGKRGTGQSNVKPRRVVIIGAGDVGAHLAKEMTFRRSMGMYPVAFFDDDRTKWNTYVHGVPVLGRVELLTGKRIDASEAVIAMPSATGKRVREVIQVLNKAKLKFEIVPSVEQMVNGDVRVSQIRAVEIEDLLGRKSVDIETERIEAEISGKVVVVTGAGGTIGSELCRQILKFQPRHLVLIERCEVLIFQIEQELIGKGHGSKLTPLVADILNEERMRDIFSRFRPEVVFHAAAHKHVPMMEHQPYEAFHNNTVGTAVLAELSSEFLVSRFVLISSDKAINPTNSMGATKRLAELYVQSLQRKSGRQTKFSAVRFGNVLGSSGSVIPTFKKQIAAGGPVTVTHPDMTRYFMTVQEAVGLVLQSATQGEGGEIFVLDMGSPVKIVDIAHQLIELSGLRPGVDIEIKFTGLRPGEKLFEELNHASENIVQTDHPMIMRFIGQPAAFETIQAGITNLQRTAFCLNPDQVKAALRSLVPEYSPHMGGSNPGFEPAGNRPEVVESGRPL
jgi:FlaA1/EpsC-like NDP-sugar epimerase